MLALLIATIAPSLALAATPQVRVFWAEATIDFDPTAPGDELFLDFAIAPLGILFETYSLTNFVFPAGSESGIYSASTQGTMAAWTTTVTTTNTILDGSASPIAPDAGYGTLLLYSHFTHTRLVPATALGIDAQGNPVAFESPQVEVPAPPPPAPLLRITLTDEQLTVSADALVSAYHYTLQAGQDLAAMTNLAGFWATNVSSQVLEATRTQGVTSQFYRLRSP